MFHEQDKPTEENCTDFQDSDDDKLQKLLISFDLSGLFECLKSNGVTYRCLKFISKSDIKDAITNIGLRAEFRQKLFAWRKTEINIDDDTISVDSKVKFWLEKSITSSTTPDSLGKSDQAKSLLDVRSILQNCSRGKAVLSYYEKKSQLSNIYREQLIALIVEEANCNEVRIRTSDYPSIINQIVSIFPSECEAKEFYFIPRNGRKNPGGKLYAKYTNCRAKRLKSEKTPASPKPVDDSLTFEAEFDETISVALKTELKRDYSDWNAVIDKWHKTHNLRRRDLITYDAARFIKEWPKYCDSRAIDLFKIDFNILYPGKELMLPSKWEAFKTKIEVYYRENVHSKKLLADLHLAENCDSSDYILTTLLPFVLPPTSWYKSTLDATKKKITLLDAQESFVLRLCSMNDYERKISEIVAKNFSHNFTIQPFIIVEGVNAFDIKSFFVYFDKNLYRLNSFINCLDTCFKIFNTLNLKYPIAAQLPWLFVQKFFFRN